MYDIRGKVGSELLINQVRQCAHAIAFYYKQLDSTVQTLGVAMDGRTHSPAIKKELVAGLQESGINVIFLGVCPTPVAYFAQYHCAIDGVLMITASHNPADYNGIKLSLRKKSLHGEQLATLARYFKECKKRETKLYGSYKEQEIIPAYVTMLVERFGHLKGQKFSLLFDSGHGAVGSVLPLLVKKLEWSDATLQCLEVDSLRAIHEADPTKEENMRDVQQALLHKNYDVACAFDGDGDRLGVMTSQGILIPGDLLLILFAREVLKKNPGGWIVCDSKSSDIVEQVVGAAGGQVQRSLTGHSFIKESINTVGALVAGELSGHFFFADRYYGFDDGIYAALRLLELLLHSKLSLSELLGTLPVRVTSPEYRVECRQGQAHEIVCAMVYFFQQQGLVCDTLDGVRVSMHDGWMLIRASNTQPVLCFRFESHTVAGLQALQMMCDEALKNSADCEFLKRKMPWQEK